MLFLHIYLCVVYTKIFDSMKSLLSFKRIFIRIKVELKSLKFTYEFENPVTLG